MKIKKITPEDICLFILNGYGTTATDIVDYFKIRYLDTYKLLRKSYNLGYISEVTERYIVADNITMHGRWKAFIYANKI